MTRRKKTTRRRRPPSSVFHALEAYDDLLGAFDIEDNIHDLERLLGDPLDRVVMAIARPPRPIRARHDQLVVSPLTRSWSIRVGDCGVGVARRERGIDYLVHGAVQDLQVGPRRLAATVQSTRQYRVDVEILLPPQAAMQATLERVQHARAAANGADPRLAIGQAILMGGPGLFPSAAQIHSECTCPDGPRCKHVVAAVWAFGVLLEREPEQLLSLWGLDVKDPLATGVFELPPLAADKHPLIDDLAIFGIDLLDPDATPVEAILAVESSPPAAADEPQPGTLEPPATSVATPEPVAPEPSSPAPSAEPVSAPPSQQSEVQREYLRVIGISARTIDTWLRSGVLRKTDRAGVYQRTPEVSQKITDFLAR